MGAVFDFCESSQKLLTLNRRTPTANATIATALLVVAAATLAITFSDHTSNLMHSTKKPNRLIHEKSPYLLQHAYNPVDWYPWGEEAFAKARAEDKPIFLSIGYSTCHWCHVMEEESFENDSIAALMNQYFVCIKVDREERPDVDRVYMTALQGMGQNGGWPMSMFLTPDLKPFFGGTYYPPESRYGRIGFPELLRRIHEIWTNDRAKVLEAADGVVSFLQQLSTTSGAGKLTQAVLDHCFNQFKQMYDAERGGFGGAPKFPRPVVFNFLLRYHHRTGNADALRMTEHTLERMANGGMYDHIGGGFHRYAVDAEWRVPHFEKMLYDQAQLVNSYIDAYLLTGKERYATIVREVLEYVLRDMTGEQGGFFSAEDADSPRPESPEQKGEGAFYVWTKKEILDVLGTDMGRIFCFHYGVEEDGNVTVDPQLEFAGRNILYVARPLAETAVAFQRSETEVASMIASARKLLFDARARRPRPHLDDKVLAGWNGLMMSALARAYQALGERRYLDAARSSAQFILEKMIDPGSGKLLRRFRDGQASLEAHLDDYAFVVSGLLDLYEADFHVRWLEQAIQLTQLQLDIFWDEEGGGFFDTSGEDRSILVRTKEHYDGAEPAGNSIAAMNLLRLYHMTGNDGLRVKAERTIEAFSGVLEKQPVVQPQMVCAYDFLLSKVKQIVIAGSADDELTLRMVQRARQRYLPNKIVLLLEPSSRSRLETLAPFTRQLQAREERPLVYVCEDYVCQLPTSDPAVVERLLTTQ